MQDRPRQLRVADLVRPVPSARRTTVLACRVLLLFAGLLLGIGNSLASRKATTPIALFVDNSDGRRGTATVVIETRIPLDLRSGKITVELMPENQQHQAPAVLASVLSVDILSKKHDAVATASLSTTGNRQVIGLQFESRSATVNRTAGPLAVLRLRLAKGARKGTKYRLQLRPSETVVQDRRGRVVDVTLHDGELAVRGSRAPYRMAVGDDVAAPGTVASFDLQTMESVNLSHGQLGLRYDATIAAGKPTVRMTDNHGSGNIEVTYPEPGLMVLRFSSPRADWSSVPGSLLTILLPLATGVTPGTSSTVTVDQPMTDLSDDEGQDVSVRFSAGHLKVGDDLDTDNDGVADPDDPDDDNDGILDSHDTDDNNDGIADADDNDADNDGIDDSNDPDDDNDGIPDDQDTDDDSDGDSDDDGEDDGGNGSDDG